MEKRYKKDHSEKHHGRDRDRDGGYDDGGDRGFRKRRARPAADQVFDYKDLDTLKQFVAEDGKIVPARISKISYKQQRQLTQAIKRARQLALLPVSASHI